MYKEYTYNSTELDHTSKYIHQKLIDSLIEYKGCKILDLGCGNGSLVNELNKLGFDAYGADASETGIAIAKNSFGNKFFHIDVNKNTPQEILDLKFDIIISTEVIEHLYSPQNFVDMTLNILKNSKEKVLIISTPYHGYLKNLLISILNKWDKHWSPEWEGGHIKFWSYNTLRNFLTNKGFSDFKFIGCGRYPYLWKSMLIISKYNAH